MAIFENKNGTWTARIYIGTDPKTGKGKYKKKTTFKNQRQAKDWERKHAQSLKDELKEEDLEQQYTISKFTDKWLTVKKKEWRISSSRHYGPVTNRIKKGLGNFLLNEVTPEDILEFYEIERKAGYAPQTIDHIHQVLRNIYKHAVRTGVLDRNIMDRIDPPKVPRQTIHYWTIDEVKFFINHQEVKNHIMFPLFYTLLMTGARLGELVGLQWGDVNFDQKFITITKTWSQLGATGEFGYGSPKTEASIRRIDLDSDTIKLLQDNLKKQKELFEEIGYIWSLDSLVFPNYYNKPFIHGNVRRSLQRLCKRIGLKYLHPHGFRHTHATMMLTLNENPKIVQERLGHASIDITLNTYSHVIPSLSKQAIANLASALHTPKDDDQ